MARGRYYVGRVIKLGDLNQERLINAIAQASILTVGKFRWTVTNVHDQRNANIPYVYGKLAKYSDEGHVVVVDTETRSEVDAIAENLLVASAPFVYLPSYSGIAYMHVWNGISFETFPKRFKSVIEATYRNFFVDCSVEPISDYRQFATKLRGLDVIRELSAKVYPPNPLFGRLWSSLNAYIKERNASELHVSESQDDNKGLATRLIALVEALLKDPNYEPKETVQITDAAVLMAADGYGLGKVIGTQAQEEVVIRTSDTQRSFLFDKEPVPDELAEEADRNLKRVSEERNLKHQ